MRRQQPGRPWRAGPRKLLPAGRPQHGARVKDTSPVSRTEADSGDPLTTASAHPAAPPHPGHLPPERALGPRPAPPPGTRAVLGEAPTSSRPPASPPWARRSTSSAPPASWGSDAASSCSSFAAASCCACRGRGDPGGHTPHSGCSTAAHRPTCRQGGLSRAQRRHPLSWGGGGWTARSPGCRATRNPHKKGTTPTLPLLTLEQTFWEGSGASRGL